MANELIAREDIVRGKKNFDAFDKYLNGAANEKVTLPIGKQVKTLAGIELQILNMFPDDSAGMRKVGASRGNIPLAEQVFAACNSFISTPTGVQSFNDLPLNSRAKCDRTLSQSPSSTGDLYFIVETVSASISNSDALQTAQGITTGMLFSRIYNSAEDTWSAWLSIGSTAINYRNTTAASANLVITPTGDLQRSTSSKIFKKDIADISIPDYRAALKAVRPVSYRSTDATSDRTDWSWYSFIAEEIAAIDPRLAQMDSVEFFEDTDEEGKPFINSRELPEGEYAANGINTNGIVALMVHINQQMLTDIETLESEKTQMKSRMTKLEKRLDALEQSAQPTAK